MVLSGRCGLYWTKYRQPYIQTALLANFLYVYVCMCIGVCAYVYSFFLFLYNGNGNGNGEGWNHWRNMMKKLLKTFWSHVAHTLFTICRQRAGKLRSLYITITFTTVKYTCLRPTTSPPACMHLYAHVCTWIYGLYTRCHPPLHTIIVLPHIVTHERQLSQL